MSVVCERCGEALETATWCPHCEREGRRPKMLSYEKCPDGACTNHAGAGYCIICGEAAVEDDCAVITNWLCAKHWARCHLLDSGNRVLKAWNKHCAQAEKEVQDAYGRD